MNLHVKGVKHYRANARVEKVKLEVNSVTFFKDDGETFGNTPDIRRDDGTGAYPTPHWEANEADGTEAGHPVLCTAGYQLWTWTGFAQTGAGQFPVRIKGKASGGGTSFTLWGTMQPDSGPVWYVETSADDWLAANKVDYYNPMTIRWQYAHPSREKFLDAGRSTNQVYVTWKVPTTGNLYHTAVDVACRNAVGETTENYIVESIWADFSGLSVLKWDGSGPMRCWGPLCESNVWNGNILVTTAELVKYGEGKCGAWQDFFKDVLSVHQIQSLEHTIAPAEQFETFVFYDTPGQGGNPLVQGAFGNHGVNSHADVLYDPSYGETYADELSWEDGSIKEYRKSLPPPVTDPKGTQETEFHPPFTP